MEPVRTTKLAKKNLNQGQRHKTLVIFFSVSFLFLLFTPPMSFVCTVSSKTGKTQALDRLVLHFRTVPTQSILANSYYASCVDVFDVVRLLLLVSDPVVKMKKTSIGVVDFNKNTGWGRANPRRTYFFPRGCSPWRGYGKK